MKKFRVKSIYNFLKDFENKSYSKLKKYLITIVILLLIKYFDTTKKNIFP